MRFQLVLQFETAGDAHDYDKLVQFEETLMAAVGHTALVDGHDTGSGEMNIFILTDDPLATFRVVQQTNTEMRPDGEMRAAYRSVDGEDFVLLWPPELKNFSIA